MFLRRHRLLVSKRSRDSEDTRDLDTKIEYSFETPEELKLFLEEVRGKDLLYAFDFDRISSARSSIYYGESAQESLKLWRSREQNPVCSLSFFANVENRNFEFPLSWFENTIVWSRLKPKTIRINFVHRNPSVSGRRFSWVRRRFSRSGGISFHFQLLWTIMLTGVREYT